MFRILCCGDTRTSTVFRIAVSQIVLYGGFIILFICGAAFFNEEAEMKFFDAVQKEPRDERHDDEDDDDEFVITDRVFITAALLHLVPLLLAVLLLIGMYKKKYYLLRIYIFAKIFETIINTLILLGFSIYYALQMKVYYAIILCAIPIVVGIWMLECVVIVNVYYTTKTKPKSKNQFIDPNDVSVSDVSEVSETP